MASRKHKLEKGHQSSSKKMKMETKVKTNEPISTPTIYYAVRTPEFELHEDEHDLQSLIVHGTSQQRLERFALHDMQNFVKNRLEGYIEDEEYERLQAMTDFHQFVRAFTKINDDFIEEEGYWAWPVWSVRVAHIQM